MKYQVDMQAIEDILDRDNTVEVKRNKDGNVLIIEIKKTIVKKQSVKQRKG